MNQTDDIKELVAALAKAQGKFQTAKFNKQNPHFKSKYADLSSIMDACRQPLSENGLMVMQYSEMIGEKLSLVTMIAHTSGQWIKSYLPLFPARMDSQSIGSCMTYAKRYSLSAMLGIVADEDHEDDGETAVGRGKHVESPKKEAAKKENEPQKISTEQLKVLRSLEAKLDDECHKSISNWMKSLNIDKLESVPVTKYQVFVAAFERAIQYIDQKVNSEQMAYNEIR